MCGESDLKEMGVPLGPRKKLGGFLKENAEKQVGFACKRHVLVCLFYYYRLRTCVNTKTRDLLKVQQFYESLDPNFSFAIKN